MSKHKVVIVGGGFGGVKTALDLAGDSRFQVTLVSDHTDFRYYPSLYRTATGGRRMLSSIPLSHIFRNRPVNLLHDEVTELDRKAKTIKTKVGHTVAFDSLVLGLGVKTNYFGIKGLEQYSYGIKTPDDAERLKSHLHQQLTTEKKLDLNYVVIGGGPTGVELAAELPAYLRHIAYKHDIKRPRIHVDLIEAAPRILPRMPKDFSRTVRRRLKRLKIRLYIGTVVQAQTADGLMVNNKRIQSHTVIWTAGVTNSPFFSDQDFQLNRNGKVRVDQYLQAEQDIYVIGDNADTPYSGMAQTALYDGKFVSQNLQRKVADEELKPYRAVQPAYSIPVGPYWAALRWRQLRVYGYLGWILRRMADLIGYHDYEPWQIATRRWLAEDDTEEFCPICATG